MDIRPLRDFVLVKPNKPAQTTASGLFITTSANDGAPREAEVIAVGPGLLLENGNRVRPEVEVGCTVLVPAYIGTEVERDGVKYGLIRESEIIAIFAPKG